jgi:hypothetical protein
VLQFLHLCYRCKVPPVSYTINNSIKIQPWLFSINSSLGIKPSKLTKRILPDSPTHTTNDESNNHTNKLSQKDEHMINKMLKIHESFDNNFIQSIKEKEDKEPCFARLEPHKKNLTLNASSPPPYDTRNDEPTEFYKTFLQKKTQFKAKELSVHRLNIDNVSFHPTISFVACLWNSDFTWLMPDLPFSLSIFFCSKISSITSANTEKDRILAFVDKMKPGDFEKTSKQKFSIPDSIMDLVWLTQNFHAITSLYFGSMSHSGIFL